MKAGGFAILFTILKIVCCHGVLLIPIRNYNYDRISKYYIMNSILCLILTIVSAITFANAQEIEPKYGKSQENWNKTLKQDWFNLKPNKLLAETINGITPGTALDVATGEGRNAIFLAQKGWKVIGFDIANEALDSIQKRAKQQNLKINTVHASREDFDFGTNKWDLVVLCYVDVICNGCIANDDFISTIAKSV